MKDFLDTMHNLGFYVFTMDEGDKEPQPYKPKEPPAKCEHGLERVLCGICSIHLEIK